MFILETTEVFALSVSKRGGECSNWMSSLLRISVSEKITEERTGNILFWSSCHIVAIKLDFGKPLCQPHLFWKDSKKAFEKKSFKLFLLHNVLKFHLRALKKVRNELTGRFVKRRELSLILARPQNGID